MSSNADIFTLATQLAILVAGRTPVWSAQPTADIATPPTTETSGVALQGAARTLVYVALREDPATRTARLTVPTVDLTATYAVIVNGTTVSYDANAAAAADLEDVIQGIRDAINAGVGGVVTATSEDTDDDAADDRVVVVGDAEADYSIAFTGTGAAVVLAVADLAAVMMRLWWKTTAREGSTPPSPFVTSGDFAPVDRRGFLERFDSAGFDRLHVQVANFAGHPIDGGAVTYTDPTVQVGPSLSEIT